MADRQAEIRATRLSSYSQQQLTDLSEADYKEVMGILKRKKLGRKRISRKIHKRAARRAAIRDVKPRAKRKSKIAEIIGGKKTYLYRQKQIEAKVVARKKIPKKP